MPVIVLITAIALASCGNGHLSESDAKVRVTGPDVKSLTHDELMGVLHECHQYGASDDPRVKYTIAYCSAAQSAHSMEGYVTRSSAVVDPSLSKLH